MKATCHFLSTIVVLFIMQPDVSAAPPGGHLNITQVYADDTSIMIIGEDLLFGPNSPAVTLGDAFSWTGHFFVEHNKPSSFRYPRWSLRGDWQMLTLFLTPV